ncbi:hypothetical protein HDU76_000566 [Blyttiomyces sp. JEL0837]|nr:hypothetical protein HDU76_000566 [Blyttiomyces sp. JEL0837]
MSHRTGLARHDLLMILYLKSQSIIERIQYLEPSFQFREHYQYNNHMFNVAGTLAGKVSGLGSWSNVIRKRILEPLGMSDSVPNFEEFCTSNGDVAEGYNGNGDSNFLVPKEGCTALASSNPAGGIGSNVHDLAKWLNLVINYGKLENGTSLVSLENFNKLVTPHTPLGSVGKSKGYALGWGIDTKNGRTRWQHTGGTMGFITNLHVFPEEDFAFIVLSNTDNPSAMYYLDGVPTLLMDRFMLNNQTSLESHIHQYNELLATTKQQTADHVKQVIDSRRIDTKPSVQTKSYLGTYRHDAYGAVTFFLIRNNQNGTMIANMLWETVDRQLAATVERWEYDTFALFSAKPFDFMGGPLPLFYFDFVVEKDTVVELRVRNLETSLPFVSFTKDQDRFGALSEEEVTKKWERADDMSVALERIKGNMLQ